MIQDTTDTFRDYGPDEVEACGCAAAGRERAFSLNTADGHAVLESVIPPDGREGSFAAVAFDRDQARIVGLALIHWAGNPSLWADYTWHGEETQFGRLQVVVEDGETRLTVHDGPGIGLEPESVRDLAIRLLCFAGPNLEDPAEAAHRRAATAATGRDPGPGGIAAQADDWGEAPATAPPSERGGLLEGELRMTLGPRD